MEKKQHAIPGDEGAVYLSVLTDAKRSANNEVPRRLTSLGISSGLILIHLFYAPRGLRLIQLSQKLLRRVPTVHGILANLEAKGYVVRDEHKVYYLSERSQRDILSLREHFIGTFS